MQESTNNMEIEVRLSVDKAKDLRFQREDGSETWRLTRKIIAQPQTFANRRLRYILGVWWPKKISNEE